jgi:hypothetical protein
MWVIDIVCSDDECAEEWEVVVGDLDELERVACECGCSGVALAVASFEEVRLVHLRAVPDAALEPVLLAA